MVPECSICFDEINSDEDYYKAKYSVGHACEICLGAYDPVNLEIIIHAFNVIKAKFSISKTQVINIIDILRYIAEQLRGNRQEQINVNELNNRIEILANRLGFHPIY